MSQGGGQQAIDSRARAAQRKRQQRERDKAMGIKTLQLPLSENERVMLQYNCRIRGGIDGPYDATEYIATLIRRDGARLKRDLSQLGKCANCDKPLPEGCAAKRRNEQDCWHHGTKRQLLI